jgi:hypothetical protein
MLWYWGVFGAFAMDVPQVMVVSACLDLGKAIEETCNRLPESQSSTILPFFCMLIDFPETVSGDLPLISYNTIYRCKPLWHSVYHRTEMITCYIKIICRNPWILMRFRLPSLR